MGLMILATCTLGATLFLAKPERAAIPEGSRAIEIERIRPVPKLLGGIGLVLRDRYLLHMALFVVLLNWINTHGRIHSCRLREGRCRGACRRERRGARPGHAHHRVLWQFQFLGDADQPGHPAVPGFARSTSSLACAARCWSIRSSSRLDMDCWCSGRCSAVSFHSST